MKNLFSLKESIFSDSNYNELKDLLGDNISNMFD
jgi:hypothetical protein